MASHLLGEIERVCDYLVAIDAGHLLRAAPIAELHRPRPGSSPSRSRRAETALAVPLGDPRPRVPAQATAGDGRECRSPWMNEPYDIIRDVVADLTLPLVRSTRSRRGLEDLFADADLGDERAAGPGSASAATAGPHAPPPPPPGASS